MAKGKLPKDLHEATELQWQQQYLKEDCKCILNNIFLGDDEN